MSDVKLTIGMATADGRLLVETMQTILGNGSDLGNSGVAKGIHFAIQSSCYVEANRNFIANEAVKEGSTHLFFIDSDMHFPGDTVRKLLSHNKDVCGVLYNNRKYPFKTTMRMRDDAGAFYIPTDLDSLPKEPFKCYGVATGCMLINMKVFDVIKRPWFCNVLREDGTVEWGDDMWFCKQVQEAGLEVWCDPTIPVAHIGNFPY